MMRNKLDKDFCDKLYKAYFDKIFLESEKDIVKRLGKSTGFYKGAHVATKNKEK